MEILTEVNSFEVTKENMRVKHDTVIINAVLEDGDRITCKNCGKILSTEGTTIKVILPQPIVIFSMLDENDENNGSATFYCTDCFRKVDLAEKLAK